MAAVNSQGCPKRRQFDTRRLIWAHVATSFWPFRNSRREAPAKGQQQLWRALNANLAPEQCPDEIGFFAQESQPGLAIRRHFQIGLADVTFRNLQLLIADRHRRLYFFMTG